jgi:hypothetical protein
MILIMHNASAALNGSARSLRCKTAIQTRRLRSLHSSNRRSTTRAYADGFGTMYTAAYRPNDGVVDYVWPGSTWRRGFDSPDATHAATYQSDLAPIIT